MEAGVIESPRLIPHNRSMIETTEMNPDAASNPEMRYCRVASIGEIPMGAGRLVKVGGEEVALFNLNGEYYAISDLCPHRGASLAEGFLDAGKIFCPLHCIRARVHDFLDAKSKAKTF
jgi:nitrite reductase/ring-hydroxylating ferredoxin subunit